MRSTCSLVKLTRLGTRKGCLVVLTGKGFRLYRVDARPAHLAEFTGFEERLPVASPERRVSRLNRAMNKAGTDGPPTKNQIAITGSQIAHRVDECGTKGRDVGAAQCMGDVPACVQEPGTAIHFQERSPR